MAWDKRGKRKGAKRLPERVRRFVIRRDMNRGCWFRYQGICIGTTGQVQVHHIVDAEDGGSDEPDNLTLACKPCHTHYSAQQSQKRAVTAAWDWQRQPERHPGLLP